MFSGESIFLPSLEVYQSQGWVNLTSTKWADVQMLFLLAQPSSEDVGGFLDGPCEYHWKNYIWS